MLDHFVSVLLCLSFRVTSILSSQVSGVATSFSECLNAATENSSNPDAVNALITSVFLEVRFETEFY
jgi:hypothetical protein